MTSTTSTPSAWPFGREVEREVRQVAKDIGEDPERLLRWAQTGLERGIDPASYVRSLRALFVR